MINCYVFFSDPLMVGKISELVKRIHSQLNIIKIIDPKQIVAANEHSQKDILITDYKNHQTLEMNGINEDLFNKVLVIDDIKDEEDGKIIYINKKYIITRIGTIIDDYIKDMSGEQYIPVEIHTIKTNIDYPCEIFVRLSETKHVKVLNAQHGFLKETLTKLINKKVKFLYVKAEDLNLFNSVQFKRFDNTNVDPVSAEVNAVESLHSYVNELGFDPKIIDLTKSLQNDLEEKFTHKFMKKLFVRFKEMEGSFLYNHSYLTSVIALTTGKKFSWMNYENREKIYLGCILHDLGYLHKENALREPLSKAEINELDYEQRQDILEHPMKFAKHLAQIDNVHQDVIKIVRDHHGVHGQDSYPKPVYPAEVNLIFALFVLSHELAIGLYQISFNEEKIPALVDEVCEKFNKGNYKKIIPEFRQAIDEIFFKQQAA